MAKENLQRTCATRGKPFDQNHVWENMPMAPHPGKDVPVGKLGKNQPVSLAEKYETNFRAWNFLWAELPSHNWVWATGCWS